MAGAKATGLPLYCLSSRGRWLDGVSLPSLLGALVETGTIAGIVSGLAMALIGAVSSYISYQQKKFCFSIQRKALRFLLANSVLQGPPSWALATARKCSACHSCMSRVPGATQGREPQRSCPPFIASGLQHAAAWMTSCALGSRTAPLWASLSAVSGGNRVALFTGEWTTSRSASGHVKPPGSRAECAAMKSPSLSCFPAL